MKRRPGMSMEAFKDYYENHHAPLCSKYTSPGMIKYMRRFLTPQPNPETGEDGELPFDVVTEMWFDDEKVYKGTLKYLSTTIMSDEIVEDEKQLFDRPKLRMATVVECETELAR
jgi:hypothetical protein